MYKQTTRQIKVEEEEEKSSLTYLFVLTFICLPPFDAFAITNSCSQFYSDLQIVFQKYADTNVFCLYLGIFSWILANICTYIYICMCVCTY